MNLTTNTTIESSKPSQESKAQSFKKFTNTIAENNSVFFDEREEIVAQIKKQMRDKLNDVELNLLSILINQKGSVVSRSELIEKSWGGRVVTGSSLNVAIKKIRDASKNTYLEGKIVTLPKKGYMFTDGKIDTQESAKNLNIPSVAMSLDYSPKSCGITTQLGYLEILFRFIFDHKKLLVNLVSLILWQTSFIGFLFLWWPE